MAARYRGHLDGTWIVKANMTPLALLQAIQKIVDANDKLFVVDITSKPAAWVGFNQQGSDWLKSNLGPASPE